MLETIFLSAIASIIGVVIRALLEKEKPVFYLYHCSIIGIAIGIITFFYYDSIFTFPLTTGKYLGTYILFLMSGYVLSDLFDTFTFIATHRRRKK